MKIRNVWPMLAFGVFCVVVIALEHYTTTVSSIIQFFSLFQVHVAIFLLILIGAVITNRRDKKRQAAHPVRNEQ